MTIGEIIELEANFFPVDEVREIFRRAVDQENSWTNYIIGDGVLGVSEETTEIYTKWLAHDRRNKLGIGGHLNDGFD
jgi:ribonucleoside-diphosphate reductase beta chain